MCHSSRMPPTRSLQEPVEEVFRRFLEQGPQVLPHVRDLVAEISADMTNAAPAAGAPSGGDSDSAAAAAAARAEAERKAAAEKKGAAAATEERKEGGPPTLEDFEREIRLLMKLRQKVCVELRS